MKRVIGIFLLIVLSLVSLSACGSGDDKFSIIIIPDTQTLMASRSPKLPKMTQWIVDNKESLNIKMALHVGDVFDNGENLPEENIFARQCFDNIIKSDIPIVFNMGNHDYDNNVNISRDSKVFNDLFKVSDFSGKDWFKGTYEEGKIENSYSIIEAGKVKYLVFALEFGPRDEVIDWADKLIEENDDCKVIVTTHSYMYTDGERTRDKSKHNPKGYKGVGESGNDGEDMWNKLIKKHKNIIAVFNGHHISKQGVSYRTDLGDNGNVVFQSFQNWQSNYNGYIRIITVDNKTNTFTIQVFDTDSEVYVDDLEGYEDLVMFDSEKASSNTVFSAPD